MLRSFILLFIECKFSYFYVIWSSSHTTSLVSFRANSFFLLQCLALLWEDPTSFLLFPFEKSDCRLRVITPRHQKQQLKEEWSYTFTSLHIFHVVCRD